MSWHPAPDTVLGVVGHLDRKATQKKQSAPGELSEEEVLALVPMWAGQMRDYLAGRKEFSLGRWHPSVHIDFLAKRSRGGRWVSGKEGIRLHLGGGSLHNWRFREYASIADSQRIGSLNYSPPVLNLLALTAHEVAHAVQRSNRVRHRYLERRDLAPPHGFGWRYIYGLLREEFVNPLALPGSIGAEKMPDLEQIVAEVGFPGNWEAGMDGVAHLLVQSRPVRVAPRIIRRPHQPLCKPKMLWQLEPYPAASVCKECLQTIAAHRIRERLG